MIFHIDKIGAYDNFIKECMRKYDPTIYNDSDFKILKTLKHENVLYFNKDFDILTFCTIIITPEYNKMTYTWCLGNRESVKAYVKGIDYVLARYNPLMFGKGALKFNKIRRVTQWIDKP